VQYEVAGNIEPREGQYEEVEDIEPGRCSMKRQET